MEQLKELSTYSENQYMFECFIALGIGRSSKRLAFFPDENTWEVHNEIDDSYLEKITTNELSKQTNIVDALNKGALYKY